ncbi:OmpA family protein [PVC group bacterium]|nr:OmpA family protein [PVC group bacterium]
MKDMIMKCMVALCVCGVLFICGCKSDDEAMGEGADILDFEGAGVIGEGDMPLSPRTEFGTQIQDVEFSSVQFPFDSFQIAESERMNIEAVAAYMKRSPDVTVLADGHCDERGSREYNLSLGEHRALAVRAYLIGLGVDSASIQTRSFGEEQPLSPDHNDSAWRINRRVEFSFYR